MPVTTNSAAKLHRLLWVLLVGVLVLLPNLFALQQYRATGGYLFYSNAFDESTYLSYDGALMSRSATRLAEYSVIALHRIGLSGGYINLLFDIIFPTVSVVFLRLIGAACGFSTLETLVYPFVVVAVPVVFGYSDPYYATLFNLNYSSPTLSWITLPQAYYPPFLRTPEPQVSLSVVAIATYLAIRWRSYLVAFVVAPFVYPFVGIPYAFVTLCLLFNDKGRRLIAFPAWRRTMMAALASYALTAGALLAYYSLFVKGSMLGEYLLATRLPLLSGTGAAALGLFVLLRSRFTPALRDPALFLALAPTAMVNTQLLSGFMTTPHGFEQSFGVVVLGVLLVFGIHTVRNRGWMLVAAGALSCALLAVYSSQVFVVNASIWQRMPPSEKLLDSLQRDPDSVLIGDPDLADIYSLIAPRLHFSALARSQTFAAGPILTSERFEKYLCTKQLVVQHHASELVPGAAFALLDQSFRYLNRDFALLHLNRTSGFKQVFDPSKEAAHCVSRQLQVFPALALGTELPGGSLFERLRLLLKLPSSERSLNVATLPQQWAYSAMEALPPVSEPHNRRHRPLVDVRVNAIVTRGCVGVGVLSPDQRAFEVETLMKPTPKGRVVDLVFQPQAQHHWFVVRNCFAQGASAATIEAIQLFPVTGVSVQSLDEGMVEPGR